ncbi:hypothetical protein CISIN_1g0436781mg, partial [Citrus sinensis]
LFKLKKTNNLILIFRDSDEKTNILFKFRHLDLFRIQTNSIYAALPKLLEKKKNLIKETDQYGWTPIQSTSNIADKDRKMTALHLAAGKGDARTVERIISENPKCYELVDNRGWNFLHYAMVSFHVGQLRNLLENNSLARSLIDEGDAKGNTPLHVLAAVRPKEFH